MTTQLDKPEIICKHAFGVPPEQIGEIVILMERDRTEHYKGAFDKILYELKGGVYRGITGLVNGVTVSAIYSKGPSDIADCVAFIATAKTPCTLIISTGSIGGLGKDTDMGDFVMADWALANDGYTPFLRKLKGKETPGFFEVKTRPQGDAMNKMAKAVEAVAKEYGVRAHRGGLFTTPGVSLETDDFLKEIVKHDCIAIDMETAQFYAACEHYGMNSAAIHWITDLPLTRNFFYRFHHPKQAEEDYEKKKPIWLNMANILTAIVRGYIQER